MGLENSISILQAQSLFKHIATAAFAFNIHMLPKKKNEKTGPPISAARRRGKKTLPRAARQMRLTRILLEDGREKKKSQVQSLLEGASRTCLS